MPRKKKSGRKARKAALAALGGRVKVEEPEIKDGSLVIRDGGETKHETGSTSAGVEHGGGKTCHFFQRGKCRKGTECRFEHSAVRSEEEEVEVCRNWLAGRCRYGKRCHRLHKRVPEEEKEAGFVKALESYMSGVMLEYMMERMILESVEEDSGGLLGFSESDIEELAMQGVRPYDDDAWAVLAALNGGGHGFYSSDDEDDDDFL